MHKEFNNYMDGFLLDANIHTNFIKGFLNLTVSIKAAILATFVHYSSLLKKAAYAH